MEVLIVDDHPLLHETLRAVIERVAPDAKVIAECDLKGGLARARDLKDLRLALLDLGLPGYFGTDALNAFRKAVPNVRVVVVSATDDPGCMLKALDAGAAGYIPKTSPPSVIIAALRLVLEGGIYIPPEAIAAGAIIRDGPTLTQRQEDVLRLLIRGLPNREIAVQLQISEHTVKQHAHALFERLGVSSRTQAAAVAARMGIKVT